MAGTLLTLISFPGKKAPSQKTLLQRLGSLDLVGFSIFAPAAVMFILALEWGGSNYAWDSPTIIGLFAGAGAALIVFILWEKYMGARAMIPLSIISRTVIWCSSLYMFFFIAAALTTIY